MNCSSCHVAIVGLWPHRRGNSKKQRCGCRCSELATLRSLEAKATSLCCFVDGDSDCHIVSVDSPIMIETDSDSSSYSLSNGDCC